MNEEEPRTHVNCFQCAHYAVSWDPRFPRACRFFGFKTQDMPSTTVYQSSGSQCIAFEEKEGRKD